MLAKAMRGILRRIKIEMLQNIEIVVILTCFNRKEKTKRCLDGLQESNKNIKFRFVIVDDNSKDGTYEMLQSMENVIVLRGNGTLFYSGGMRIGIEYAKNAYKEYKPDYCLIINDDVDFFEDSIIRLIEFRDDNREIVVGCTCDAKGEMSYGGERKKSSFRPVFEKVMSGASKKYCDTFDANCVLIPFELFEAADNIDKYFIHSMGDFDFGFNCRKAGGKIVASNFFVGKCEDNPADGTWQDKNLTFIQRVRMKESPKGLPTKQWYYFVKKYYGKPSAVYSVVVSWIRVVLCKKGKGKENRYG